MSTLITGVNGMIGFAVASQLALKTQSVIGLDISLPTGLKDDGVELIEANLLNFSLLDDIFSSSKIDTVVHSGGISGPMLYPDDPRKIFDINIAGTLNIAELARKHSVKRLIFLSSFVTYGNQKGISQVKENTRQRGTNPYAASKIAGETIIRSYSNEHSIEAISLRLGAVYGPRRTTDCMVRSFLHHAISQEPLKLSFGKNWSRPYVFLDDIVSAICLSLETPSSSLTQDAYNIAGGIWPSLSELANMVAQITGFQEIFLKDGRTPHDYLIGPLSLEAAARDLKYIPSYSIESGISNYYEWLKNNDF